MNNFEIGTNSLMPGLSRAVQSGLLSAFSRQLIGRLREELRHLLPAGVMKSVGSAQNTHDEAAFRFLLANEARRSKRSGRSFQILLTHLVGFDGRATKIDERITGALVPVLSTVLRETDYIGWYRDRYVLGGVLTSLGGHPPEQVSGRIEQRLWWRMGKEFPVQDFARLRVRFVAADELERIESTNSLFV